MALTDKKKALEAKESEKRDNSLREAEKVEHGLVDEPVEDNLDGAIDLTATRKKRFHVNRGSGDYGILELNTSDMSIINRLENLYPKLQKLSQDAAIKQLDKEGSDDERYTAKIAQALTKIDTEMRHIIDEIFDSNVSEVCAPYGSMMDPFNGDFRFEHIIDAISSLYENNINAEYKAMSEKMKKRTAKYTKGK